MKEKPFFDDHLNQKRVHEFEEEEYSDERMEVIQADIKQLTKDFTRSEHFSTLTDEQKDWLDFITSSFAELLYGYELLSIQDWDVQDVDYCTLELFPRKLSVDESMFRSTAPVLSAFFTYLAEIKVNRRGLELARRVREISDDIVKQSNNPANWGIAKSLFADMFSPGFDVPVTEEDVKERFSQYTFREQGMVQKKTGKKSKKKTRKDSKQSRLRNKKK